MPEQTTTSKSKNRFGILTPAEEQAKGRESKRKQEKARESKRRHEKARENEKNAKQKQD